MKEFPVLQITKDSYRFIFKEGNKILPMFMQYSILIILSYIFLHLIEIYFNFSAETISNLPIFLSFLAFTLLTLFFQTPLTIRLTRAVVTQEEIGKDYFNLLGTRRTFKTFLTYLKIILLFFGFIIGIAILLTSLITLLPSYYPQSNSFLISVMGTLFFFVIVYLFLRLSLAIPNASLDHNCPILHSWKTTKSNILQIFILIVLTALPNILWLLIMIVPFSFISLKTNPLIYGLLSLPPLYFGLILSVGLGFFYKKLNQESL